MVFAGISYIAVILATVVAFIFGAIYYGALGTQWMKAARIDPAEARMTPALFVTSFVCELIMAWMLAGLVGHLGTGEVTLWNGIVSGFFVWLGFIAVTIIVNHRYQGFGWNLSVIDGAHWLGVALLMGAVIGWWGV